MFMTPVTWMLLKLRRVVNVMGDGLSAIDFMEGDRATLIVPVVADRPPWWKGARGEWLVASRWF
jgi:hypothetical protein